MNSLLLLRFLLSATIGCATLGAMEDDAAMRNVIKKALEGKGVLAQIRVRSRIHHDTAQTRFASCLFKRFSCCSVFHSRR